MDTLSRVLEQDLMLCAGFADSGDLVEGVRALLVDRDNAPRWRHRSLEDVDATEVALLFAGARHACVESPDRDQRLPRREPAENPAAPPRVEDVE
jgi:hypothetical protein